MKGFVYMFSSSRTVFASLKEPRFFPPVCIDKIQEFEIILPQGFREEHHGPWPYIRTPGGLLLDEIAPPRKLKSGKPVVDLIWNEPGGPQRFTFPISF